MLRTLTVSLLLLVFALAERPVHAEDSAAGQRIYMSNCMACHGEKADGKGPAAAALNPRPANFTDPVFWSTRSDAQIKAVILGGKPGTAMMSFAQIKGADLDALVGWLRARPAAAP